MKALQKNYTSRFNKSELLPRENIGVCEVVSGSSKAMGELSNFWDDFLPEQVYNDIVL